MLLMSMLRSGWKTLTWKWTCLLKVTLHFWSSILALSLVSALVVLWKVQSYQHCVVCLALLTILSHVGILDLDSLAGSVAYKHVLPEGTDARDAHKAGLYVVTAAVDRLDMLRPLSHDEPEDLRLSGHVYSVGRSTMEITVRLQSISRRKGLRDTPETILLGRFTMACRDKDTGKAKAVPQLVTEGDDEIMLEKLGKEQRDKKLAQIGKSLQVVPPDEEESKMLHRVFTQFQNYYKEGANIPEEVVWMRKGTQLESVLMCHPQERNVHGNIFVSRRKLYSLIMLRSLK